MTISGAPYGTRMFGEGVRGAQQDESGHEVEQAEFTDPSAPSPCLRLSPSSEASNSARPWALYRCSIRIASERHRLVPPRSCKQGLPSCLGRRPYRMRTSAAVSARPSRIDVSPDVVFLAARDVDCSRCQLSTLAVRRAPIQCSCSVTVARGLGRHPAMSLVAGRSTPVTRTCDKLA